MYGLHQIKSAIFARNTHEIMCVDERSGRIDIVGSPSKTTDDLFAAVWTIITRFNGYGHLVEFIYVDAE